MQNNETHALTTRQRIIDAAKRVLHERGIRQTTLVEIAKTANITRCAIYWHFSDKAELLWAVRRDFLAPVMTTIEVLLSSDSFDDPLDAVEVALRTFFRFLDENPIVLQLYQNMMLRCQHADEFSRAQSEINQALVDCLSCIEQVYQKAWLKGRLSTDLSSSEVAWDTFAFANGLLHLAVAWPDSHGSGQRILDMISSHMAIRKRVTLRPACHR